MISSSSPQFGKTLDFLRSWVGLRWVFRRVICDDLCSWNLSIYRYFHMSVCQSASCLWICSRTIQTNINNLKQTVFLFFYLPLCLRFCPCAFASRHCFCQHSWLIAYPSSRLSFCLPVCLSSLPISESHLKRLQTPEFPFPFVTCNCQNVPRNDVERREEREQTEESDEHVAGGYEPGFGHPDDGFTRSSRELPRFPFWLRRENIKFNFFLL